MNDENKNVSNNVNNNIEELTPNNDTPNQENINNQTPETPAVENQNINQQTVETQIENNPNTQPEIPNVNQQTTNDQINSDPNIYNQPMNNQAGYDPNAYQQPMNNKAGYDPNAAGQPIDNQTQNTSEKKKNSKMTIIIIIVAIVALIAGVVLFTSNSSDKEKGKEENTEETKDNENNEETTSEWNGIYTNESGIIYLYQQDNEVHFEIEFDNSSAEGTAEIKGTKAEGSIFETYTFTLEGNTIKFTSTDEDLKDGTLSKTSNYTTENFFKRHFGDPEYMESDINGIYEKDDTEIRIFQTDENSAEITIIKDFSYISKQVDIENGKITYEDEFFEETKKLDITFKDKEITVTASSTDKEDTLNSINGTYKKNKEYTAIDLIRKEKFGFYD